MPLSFAALISAAMGCGGDPILDRAADMEVGAPAVAEGGGGTVAAQPPPPVEPTPGGGEPAPVVPDDPERVVPDDPPPGGAVVTSGPTITLSGRVEVVDYAGGQIRIDVFDGDQQELSGPRPSVVGVARIDQPGPWSVAVPATTEKVWIGAYADENGDGRPEPKEAAGWYEGNPVVVSADQDDLRLRLSREVPPTDGG